MPDNVVIPTRKRIDFLDVAKGLAMLLVIFGHAKVYDKELLPYIFFVYSFHMPFFFAVTGYFLSSKKNITYNIKSKAISLLIPYLITTIICSIFLLKEGLSESITNLFSYLYASTVPVESMNIQAIKLIWFLPALFIASVVTLLCLKINFFLRIIVLVLLSVISWRLWNVMNVKYLPFCLLQGLHAAIYVYIGFVCRKYDIFHRYSIALIVLAIIVHYISFKTDIAHTIYHLRVPNGILTFLGALAGVYVFIGICKLLDKVLFIKRPLKIIGENSLIVLCIHHCNLYLPWNTIHYYLPFTKWQSSFSYLLIDIALCMIVLCLWLCISKILDIYKRNSKCILSK